MSDRDALVLQESHLATSTTVSLLLAFPPAYNVGQQTRVPCAPCPPELSLEVAGTVRAVRDMDVTAPNPA